MADLPKPAGLDRLFSHHEHLALCDLELRNDRPTSVGQTQLEVAPQLQRVRDVLTLDEQLLVDEIGDHRLDVGPALLPVPWDLSAALGDEFEKFRLRMRDAYALQWS